MVKKVQKTVDPDEIIELVGELVGMFGAIREALDAADDVIEELEALIEKNTKD